jgi:O-antigen/teichoic acid export membrane protein
MRSSLARAFSRRSALVARLGYLLGPMVVLAGHGSIALLDQSLVSGGRFLTSVLVGRVCGQAALGRYSLGFTVVLTILCLQDSLISLPYNIYGGRLQGKARRRLAGSTLVHYCVLSLLASVVLAMVVAVAQWQWADTQMAPVFAAIGIVAPFVLLREFARRLAFSHLKPSAAMLLDGFVTALQLAGLGWLIGSGELSPATAHVAVGLACLAGGVAWLALCGRRQTSIAWGNVAGDFRGHWRFGRWLFASQMVFLLQWNAVAWLLAALAGTEATGAFAACLTLALLCNPFLLGMCNLLEPHTARAFVTGGTRQVGRLVTRWTMVLLLVVSTYCLLIAWLGGRGLELLYGGSYSGYSSTVTVMALAILAGTLGLAADAGLRAVERSDVGFRVNLLSLCVTLGLSAALIPAWGPMGAAWGMLTGSLVGSIARLLFLYGLVASCREGPTRRQPINGSDQETARPGI